MKKAQWETALHDTNELTRLAEWSRSSGLNPRDHVADAEILSDGFGVDQLHYLERLTTAVIAANNKSAVGAPLLH